MDVLVRISEVSPSWPVGVGVNFTILARGASLASRKRVDAGQRLEDLAFDTVEYQYSFA